MDKTVFEIKSLRDNDDRLFWKNKSFSEKIEALEQLRQRVFGYDPSSERLQRTLTITQLKKN